jgi:hypothetical protein
VQTFHYRREGGAVSEHDAQQRFPHMEEELVRVQTDPCQRDGAHDGIRKGKWPDQREVIGTFQSG